MELGILDSYPLGVGAVILLAVLLSSLEIGYWLGKRTKIHQGANVISGSKDIALGPMFALLGLIMAFTYAFTVSRADQRKQVIVDEANTIGTAFLRTELTSEPGRSELRRLLLDYARTRVANTAISKDTQAFKKAVARSMMVQAELWPATVRMVKNKGGSPGPLEISIVQAVNEVLDMQGQRAKNATDRLPGVTLLMLVFIAAASLAVAGFNSGLSGSLNRWRMTILTSVLAMVMLIIIDFDLPMRGFIEVSQMPLEKVIDGMETSLSGSSTTVGNYSPVTGKDR